MESIVGTELLDRIFTPLVLGLALMEALALYLPS